MKRLFPLLLLALALPGTAAAAKKKPEVVAPLPPPPPVVDPEAWRATPPEPGKEGTWKAPVATTFTLSNGIPVYVVPNPGLPLVTVELLLGVGREANPAGKEGLASLTANLLDEGTTSRSSAKIAEDAASLGATLSVGGSTEAAWVHMDALTATLGPSLDLMADVTLHPAFAKDQVARVQAEVRTAIQAEQADPNAVARRVFAANLFGTGHPYGTPAIGTETSVASLTVGDVKKFYKTWWHAGNAALIVTGAVTQAEIQPALEARFGGWKAGKATRLSVIAPSAPLKTRVVYVEQPGAVQSVIRVGTVGLARTSPDYMAANLAGTALCGMFSSPVNMNLREEHGWSYGAYGGFSESRDHGTFAMGGSVQADKTAPAVVELLKELTEAVNTGPSEALLTMSRDYLRKSVPGNFETNAATAGSFVGAPLYGLGPDLWSRYVQDVGGVSTADVAAAAKRFFPTDRQLVVVVGPRTLEVPGADGATVKVDVVAELQALGHEFVDATPK